MRSQNLRRSSLHALFWCAVFVLVCGSAPQVFAQSPAPPDFGSLSKAAAADRDAGNTYQAMLDYQRALALRPQWTEGWWNLGTIEYENNLYPQAIAAYREVVRADPQLGTAWTLLGLCEFETNDYRDALAHLKKGRALGTSGDPDTDRVAAYHLALLFNRDGDFEQAGSTLAKQFGQNPFPAQAKTVLGLALLRVPLLPDEVAPTEDALVQSAGDAAALLQQGGPEKALPALADLTARYPSAPYLHYAYGLALASAGHLKEAIAQQLAEAALSPASALPQIEIASLEARMHHSARSLQAAEKAVRLAPGSAAAHKILAQALQSDGRAAKASEEALAAKTFAPEKPVRDARILALYAVGGSAAKTQTAAASDALSPAAADQILHQAATLEANSQPDAAIQLYRQTLETHPEWDPGRWNLAMLDYSTENYPAAIRSLAKWVAQKPNDGTAWAVLGLSEFATKDYANALLHLERGEQLGFRGTPEQMQLAACRLAILLNQKGDFARAREVLAPLAAAVKSPELAQQIQITLGMSLLRMPLLPAEVEPSQLSLLTSAGQIAVLLQDSRYDAASLKFEELLKIYPTQPFLHYAYGMELASLSRFDEAAAEMRLEAKISPKSELPFVQLASIALRQHLPAKAIEPAQRAVKMVPGSSEAHYILGRTYLELNQPDAAIRELKATNTLQPDSPEVHFALARAYAKAHQPQQAEQERATFVRLNAIAAAQSRHEESPSSIPPQAGSTGSSQPFSVGVPAPSH